MEIDSKTNIQKNRLHQSQTSSRKNAISTTDRVTSKKSIKAIEKYLKKRHSLNVNNGVISDHTTYTGFVALVLMPNQRDEMLKNLKSNEKYIDALTGNHIEIVIVGYDSSGEFYPKKFMNVINDIANNSSWRWNGEPQMVIMKYIVTDLSLCLNYNDYAVVRIEEMIKVGYAKDATELIGKVTQLLKRQSEKEHFLNVLQREMKKAKLIPILECRIGRFIKLVFEGVEIASQIASF